jgi:hypothetical protein
LSTALFNVAVAMFASFCYKNSVCAYYRCKKE